MRERLSPEPEKRNVGTVLTGLEDELWSVRVFSDRQSKTAFTY